MNGREKGSKVQDEGTMKIGKIHYEENREMSGMYAGGEQDIFNSANPLAVALRLSSLWSL